jgi:hypothetical protein
MRTQALILMKTATYRKLAPSSDAFAHAVSGTKIKAAIKYPIADARCVVMG